MEFSTGSIGAPPGGDASDWGDISHLMWPSYRRMTAVAGGDIEASFVLQGHAADLQDRFVYLGAPFHEQFAGHSTFRGFVYEFRLAVGGLNLIYSLADVYNRVAVRYRSVLTGATNTTDFIEDQASQLLWGRRTIILPMIAPIDYLEAQAVAAAFLADHKAPRIVRGSLAGNAQIATLKVTIRGLATALDDDLYDQDVPGTDTADNEVRATLAGNMAGPGRVWVQVGEIARNDTPVSIQADQRPRLKRITDIAQARDDQGRRYRFGCFGSDLFAYQPIENQVRYRVTVQPNGETMHWDMETGAYVPAPLVQPGSWSVYAPDVFNAAPGSSDPTDTAAAQLDESVVYQNGTAVLQGGRTDTRSYLETVMMTMIARRQP